MTETPPPPGEPQGEPLGQPLGEPQDTTSAYDAAYGTSDTIASEPPPSNGGRRGLVIGASAAVLALLAGAAVYASTILSGGGRQPDELVPKSAYVYAKIDLDPALGQKLAARSFFQHFPKLKSTVTSEDSPFEQALETLVSGGGQDLNFKTDIKPWFDRRAAFAVFNRGSHPTVIAVLRSKDDAKARTAMDRAVKVAKDAGTNDLAYAVSKGYVVIGETDADVDDALKQAEQASLNDNDVYRKDVGTLTGDQVGTAWVDIQPAIKAALAETPQGGLLPVGIVDRFKGRTVAGLHFANDYLEMEAKAYGVDQSLLPKGADPTLLKNLPASTVAAWSMNNLRQTIETGLGATGFNPGDLIDGMLEGTGLTFDHDLLPLLGNQTVLTLGSALGFFTNDVKVGLVSTIADIAKATVAGKKVESALQQLGVPVKATVKGNTFYLATPEAYAGELTKDGSLGASPTFIKAVGDLGTPSLVGYVDLQKFLGAEPNTDGAAWRAMAIVSGVKDGDGYARFRLTVG